MTDLSVPQEERRTVSFAEALVMGQVEVCGVVAAQAEPSVDSIKHVWAEGKIPVIADPESKILGLVKPDIFIDGVMAKRNTGTTIKDAPLVIALGPGFTAGKDVRLAVETNPGSPSLGRVISKGHTEEDTGIPTPVAGLTTERLLRAPAEGTLFSRKRIGDRVAKDETIGYVNLHTVKALVSGCLWGLVRDGTIVKKGQKIGDIDPRGEKELCFRMTAEARTIADGVLEAISLFRTE